MSTEQAQVPKNDRSLREKLMAFSSKIEPKTLEMPSSKPIGRTTLKERRIEEFDAQIESDIAVLHGLQPDQPPTGEEIMLMRPISPLDAEDEARGESLEQARKTTKTYDQMVKQTFAEAMHESRYTLPDLLPQRIKVAWRISREIARHLGLVNEDETLEEALIPSMDTQGTPGRDLWLAPTLWAPRAGPYFSRQSFEVVRLMKQSADLPPERGYPYYNPSENKWEGLPGIAPLPPGVPIEHRSPEDMTILPEYDPSTDRVLMNFIGIVRAVSHILYIDRGSVTDPDYGRFGLQGLLDPTMIREAWPSRMQIMVWERLVVEQALEFLVVDGAPRAKKRLVREYGLQDHEVNAILKQAKVLAHRQLNSDIEEERSVMILRLEEFVRRSKNALDLRAELAGLKQMSVVLGLARVEGNDPMSDFIDVVKKVSSERQQVSIVAGPGPKALE